MMEILKPIRNYSEYNEEYKKNIVLSEDESDPRCGNVENEFYHEVIDAFKLNIKGKVFYYIYSEQPFKDGRLYDILGCLMFREGDYYLGSSHESDIYRNTYLCDLVYEFYSLSFQHTAWFYYYKWISKNIFTQEMAFSSRFSYNKIFEIFNLLLTLSKIPQSVLDGLSVQKQKYNFSLIENEYTNTLKNGLGLFYSEEYQTRVYTFALNADNLFGNDSVLDKVKNLIYPPKYDAFYDIFTKNKRYDEIFQLLRDLEYIQFLFTENKCTVKQWNWIEEHYHQKSTYIRIKEFENSDYFESYIAGCLVFRRVNTPLTPLLVDLMTDRAYSFQVPNFNTRISLYWKELLYTWKYPSYDYVEQYKIAKSNLKIVTAITDIVFRHIIYIRCKRDGFNAIDEISENGLVTAKNKTIRRYLFVKYVMECNDYEKFDENILETMISRKQYAISFTCIENIRKTYKMRYYDLGESKKNKNINLVKIVDKLIYKLFYSKCNFCENSHNFKDKVI